MDRIKRKHIGFTIDPETHRKQHYIADYEGRSANGQILYLIRKCIMAFERENGAIPFSMDEEERQ